jgi:hypothetical protein
MVGVWLQSLLLNGWRMVAESITKWLVYGYRVYYYMASVWLQSLLLDGGCMVGQSTTTWLVYGRRGLAHRSHDFTLVSTPWAFKERGKKVWERLHKR